MNETRVLVEAALPVGTPPEVAEEAAALLQRAMADTPGLADPEVSLGAERASAELALVIDAIVTYAPHLVAAAAGATTILKAIETAKALFGPKTSDKPALTPAQRLIADLPIDRVMVQLDDGTRVPLSQLLPAS